MQYTFICMHIHTYVLHISLANYSSKRNFVVADVNWPTLRISRSILRTTFELLPKFIVYKYELSSTTCEKDKNEYQRQ